MDWTIWHAPILPKGKSLVGSHMVSIHPYIYTPIMSWWNINGEINWIQARRSQREEVARLNQCHTRKCSAIKDRVLFNVSSYKTYKSSEKFKVHETYFENTKNIFWDYSCKFINISCTLLHTPCPHPFENTCDLYLCTRAFDRWSHIVVLLWP